MLSSGVSFDPFLISAEYLNQSGFRDTKGRTPRSTAINPALKTLVLISAGQSNSINITPSAITLTTGSKIDNFNIYDGGLYDAAGKMLGTQDAGSGAISQKVADLFATSGRFDRVIVAPCGISGTPISVWANGGLLVDRIPLTIRRLASRGIVPGMTGVTFALLWMQGEAEGGAGISGTVWASGFADVKANALAAGFSGRIFNTTETWDGGAPSASVQAGQASVRDNVTVFDGGNLDTLDNSYRQDTTHFNDTGASNAGTLIYNAMVASGAPY